MHRGNFADALGDDFFGLKALGIAEEFGLTSLTIPRRLLRAKRRALADASASYVYSSRSAGQPTHFLARNLRSTTATKEIFPYPPPPPLEPLRAGRVEDQIGLLQPYLTERFVALTERFAPPPPDAAVAALAALPPMPGITLPSAPALPAAPATGTPGATPTAPESIIPPPDLALPEDPPEPARCKLGPLGQVLKSASAPGAGAGGAAGAAAAKKKAQAAQQAAKKEKEAKEAPRPVGRPPKPRALGTPAAGATQGKKKKALAPAPPPGGGTGGTGQMVIASA